MMRRGVLGKGYPLTRSIFALLLAAPLLAACSSSTSGSGSCANIAGTWSIGGSCNGGGTETCVVTQNGCSTNFSCVSGTVSYTGSVSGNSVSYSGTSATGASGTCSGTVNGNAISGTCNSGGTNCTFSGTKQ